MVQKVLDLSEEFFRDSKVLKILPLQVFVDHNLLEEDKLFKYDDEYAKLSRTAKVAIRDNYSCQDCGRRATYATIHQCKEAKYVIFWLEYNDTFTILTKDHIISKAYGGKDAYTNLQCMCYECNQEKAHEVDGEIWENYVQECYRKNEVAITSEELKEKTEKIKDFFHTRKRIKNCIKKMPWYYKLLGVDKYIDKELKQPLTEKGYYSTKKAKKARNKKK